MSEVEHIELDAEERAAIAAEFQRQRAEPPSTEGRKTWGCLTVLAAGFLLLLIPQLSKRYGWPPPWMADILFWLLVIALALGFFMSMVMVSGRYARASRRAREALDWLASHPGARDAEARRHAVALIDNYFVDESGGTSTTIDIDEAKKQLGANLQYVVAVEQALSTENRADIFGPP